MLECPFFECRGETTLPMETVTHLMVAIDHDDRAHIHGPVFDKTQKLWVIRMLVEVARFCNIDLQELADSEKDYLETHVPDTIQ